MNGIRLSEQAARVNSRLTEMTEMTEIDRSSTMLTGLVTFIFGSTPRSWLHTKDLDAIQLSCAAAAGVDLFLFITNDRGLHGKHVEGMPLERLPLGANAQAPFRLR